MPHASTTKALIRVTKRHIRNGKPSRACECPLALAANDAGYANAIIFAQAWSPYGSIMESDAIPLPESAIEFRQRFDELLPVKPRTFRLPLPAPVFAQASEGGRGR